MEKMMAQMMNGMTEKCFAEMDGEEICTIIHDFMPEMMDSCFSKMNDEQQKGMLDLCRDMLNEVEKKYGVQTDQK
jgi:hypothetical protein